MTTKRYEFTGETKTDPSGRVLRQIRALVAITSLAVNIGDLGGWIEYETNLPHDGTAWVYPDATVAGKYTTIWGGTIEGGTIEGGTIRGGTIRGGTIRGGTIRGGTIEGGTIWGGTIEGGTEIKNREPVFLSGFSAWPVTMTDEHMTIGCQTHTFKEWLAFKEFEISNMSGDSAMAFWKQHKARLKGICKATGRL